MEDEALKLIKKAMKDVTLRVLLSDRVVPSYLQAAFAVDKKTLLVRAMKELVEEIESE